MSYIDPKLSKYFDPLSEELKSAILQRDVQLYTLTDLIHCLEAMVEAGEAAYPSKRPSSRRVYSPNRSPAVQVAKTTSGTKAPAFSNSSP